MMTDFKEYSELFHAAERGRRKSYSSISASNRRTNTGGGKPTASTRIMPNAQERLLLDRLDRLCNAMYVSPENVESNRLVKSLKQRLKRCKQHDTGDPHATNIYTLEYEGESWANLDFTNGLVIK